MDAVIEQIVDLFARQGSAAYLGEAVSQQEHALQTAWLAEQAGARPELIAAALLHDVGHLLHDLGEDVAERGHDSRHEILGQEWLARHFGPAVTEPVRLHVAAKRFLVATEAAYRDGLSPASQRSLALQGGPFTPEEAKAFQANPHADAAVALRCWDDTAKVPGLPTPSLAQFLPALRGALSAGTGSP